VLVLRAWQRFISEISRVGIDWGDSWPHGHHDHAHFPLSKTKILKLEISQGKQIFGDLVEMRGVS
jgi:hypothetical protein